MDVGENRAHFPRACSFICAKARGGVLSEIESARFSSPPNSPANFNTARAAGSQWKRNQRNIYFDAPKICINVGNLLRKCAGSVEDFHLLGVPVAEGKRWVHILAGSLFTAVPSIMLSHDYA